MAQSSYREEQEAFVSGLTGSSFFETFILIQTLSSFSALVGTLHIQSSWFLEFAVRAVPLLLFNTLLADYVVYLGPLFLVIVFAKYWLSKKRSKSEDVLSRDVLTVYRADMMLSTVIAILAVDFTVFPRRFAKTETYGWSVMDAGVGSFVFSSGMVSSSRSRKNSFLKSVAPLLALGAVRFFLTSAADYQKHVSEYGVHWNFFLTLAVVAALSDPALRIKPSWSFGAVMLYQLWLVFFPFGEYNTLALYLWNSPRTDFFSANREGIFSVIGYLAISNAGRVVRKACVDLKMLSIVSLGCAIAAYALDSFVEPCSRRSCNLPYVFFIVSVNTFCLFVMSCLRIRPLTVQKSVNANSLLLFLVANLLTGAVNKTVYTIYAGPLTATAILCGYLMTFFLMSVLFVQPFLVSRVPFLRESPAVLGAARKR
eukprot:ANDGO_00597.mRNA.1 hypothetical protein